MNIEYVKGEIYKKTWTEEFWGHNGAIHLARELYYELHTPEALMGLASTYYAAAGNAGAKAKSGNPASRFYWFIVALVCSIRALFSSSKVEGQVGLSNMTADQLDVRASILERVSLRGAAVSRINTALLKKLPIDTEVLLYAKKGILMHKLKNEAGAEVCFRNGHMLTRDVKPTTLVRFAKSRAIWRLESGDRSKAKMDFLAAKGIATEHGLKDQLEKIEPYLEELKDVDTNVVRWDYVFPLKN